MFPSSYAKHSTTQRKEHCETPPNVEGHGLANTSPRWAFIRASRKVSINSSMTDKGLAHEQGDTRGNFQEKQGEQVRSVSRERQLHKGAQSRAGTPWSCRNARIAGGSPGTRSTGRLLAPRGRQRQRGNGILKRDSETRPQNHRSYW